MAVDGVSLLFLYMKFRFVVISKEIISDNNIYWLFVVLRSLVDFFVRGLIFGVMLFFF